MRHRLICIKTEQKWFKYEVPPKFQLDHWQLIFDTINAVKWKEKSIIAFKIRGEHLNVNCDTDGV